MKTIEEFNARFPNEDACHEYLFKARFGEGVYCPHCGHKHAYAFSDGKTYKDVTVISHDASIVPIKTADGLATFPISLLGTDIQSSPPDAHPF